MVVGEKMTHKQKYSTERDPALCTNAFWRGASILKQPCLTCQISLQMKCSSGRKRRSICIL